jgi:hypothetical protein
VSERGLAKASWGTSYRGFNTARSDGNRPRFSFAYSRIPWPIRRRFDALRISRTASGAHSAEYGRASSGTSLGTITTADTTASPVTPANDRSSEPSATVTSTASATAERAAPASRTMS